MSIDRGTLSFWLGVAWGQRWFVLVPAVFVFFAAALITTVQEDVYESKSVLMAQMAKPSDGLIRKAVVATARDMLRGTRERLLSYDLLARVIEEKDLYPELRRKEGLQSAVRRFRGRARVSVSSQSRAITVSFKHSGGERAADVAADTVNRLVELFVLDQRNAVSQKAIDVKRFIEKEELSLLHELEEAERALERFRADHVGELPEDRDTNRQVVSQYENRIERCLDRMMRNREEVNRAHVDSFELKRALKRASQNTGSGDRFLRAFRQNVSAMEEQLARDLTRYQDDSDHITSLRARIDLAKNRLQTLEQSEEPSEDSTKAFYQWLLDANRRRQETLEADSARCEKRIQEAREHIATAEKCIATAAYLDSQYRALLRRVNDAESRRKVLLAKRETASFAVDFQDHDPSAPIEVEQRAFASSKPVGPRRMLTSLTGLFLGLAAGIGLALLRVKFDHSFRRTDDLRRLLPGSVLITIPDISGVGVRASRVFANVILGLFLTGLLLTGIGVLGLRMGWWGNADMLRPLIELGRLR